MTKIFVSVFNNLSTDQRIEKICKTLHDRGFQVELIGSSWGGLPEMQRPYAFTRIPLKSKILKWAYLEYNYKLYFLLKNKSKGNCILVANDLETILPNYFLSKSKNLPLVYDSHEIFTEMPTVQGRFSQNIWRIIEKYCIPKLKYMMTANASYSDWYEKTYAIPKPETVRNLPRLLPIEIENISENMPKIILYQGVLNPSRGLDKIIPAMLKINNAQLWIAGDGPESQSLKNLVAELNLTKKVNFLGQLAPNELRKITPKADVGLSIEENNGWSYYYSLPNKISDYIQSGVPVVCSNFPEMVKIVTHFSVGETIENHTEEELIAKINTVLKNGKSFYKENLQKAAATLCWENEEPILLELYNRVIADNFQE
jgi:glycosyltransferase involved in cell wall biosynthesis